MMVIGLGMVTLRLHECRSLKAKRSVVKSVVSQIRNKFNASVAEIADHDIYQRAKIGFALVGNDHAVINSKVDKIFNMVEEMGVAELIDTDMEIMKL